MEYIGISSGGLLSLVILFFNSSVINKLDNYVPNYLSESYYFYHNLSDPKGGPRPVDEDPIYANSTIFPKCCPPDTSYNVDHRGCVPSINTISIYEELNITVNLIRSVLIDCIVVVDRFVKKKDLKRRDGNVTLEIGKEIYTSDNFCVDNIFQNSEYYVVRLCRDIDFCTNVNKTITDEWCVHKCCDDGYGMEDYECTLYDKYGIDVKNNTHIYERTDGYAMMYGTNLLNCERSHWNDFEEADISIKTNGSLFVDSTIELGISDYCLGTNYDKSTGRISDSIFYCELRTGLYVVWILIKIAVTVTCICFVLTLAVYVFVYKLRKKIEKIITCFCLVDLTFWFMYDWRIFDLRFGEFCTPFAYIYFFVTISRLSWLNVLSYEIWTTIGTSRRFRCRSMIGYTIYAVAVPTVTTLFFILGNQKVYILPLFFVPLVNKATCFIDIRRLDGNLGDIHLYIPVSILIVINIIFFVNTLLNYLKIKRDLAMIPDSNVNKQAQIKKTNKKGFIIFKLSLVMGVTWIYYIYAYICSFENNEILEFIGDFLSFANIFEGVYFFVIFVVKWKTIRAISAMARRTIFSKDTSVSDSTISARISTFSSSGMSTDIINEPKRNE